MQNAQWWNIHPRSLLFCLRREHFSNLHIFIFIYCGKLSILCMHGRSLYTAWLSAQCFTMLFHHRYVSFAGADCHKAVSAKTLLRVFHPLVLRSCTSLPSSLLQVALLFFSPVERESGYQLGRGQAAQLWIYLPSSLVHPSAQSSYLFNLSIPPISTPS